MTVQRDVLTAAVLLHDSMKPYATQWRADGTQTVQVNIAGTASHHIFALAEAIHRHLPAAVVVALAAAHDAPGTAEARVVGFLWAGAILAGEDPRALGLLKAGEDGKTILAALPSFEAAISHLSDHDYVVSEPSAHVVSAAVERLIRSAPGGAALRPEQLRWGRYRIEARVPALRLYAALLEGGDEAVRRLLLAERVALVSPEDL